MRKNYSRLVKSLCLVHVVIRKTRLLVPAAKCDSSLSTSCNLCTTYKLCHKSNGLINDDQEERTNNRLWPFDPG